MDWCGCRTCLGGTFLGRTFDFTGRSAEFERVCSKCAAPARGDGNVAQSKIAGTRTGYLQPANVTSARALYWR